MNWITVDITNDVIDREKMLLPVDDDITNIEEYIYETGNVNELFLVIGKLKIKLTQEQMDEIRNFFQNT